MALHVMQDPIDFIGPADGYISCWTFVREIKVKIGQFTSNLTSESSFGIGGASGYDSESSSESGLEHDTVSGLNSLLSSGSSTDDFTFETFFVSAQKVSFNELLSYFAYPDVHLCDDVALNEKLEIVDVNEQEIPKIIEQGEKCKAQPDLEETITINLGTQDQPREVRIASSSSQSYKPHKNRLN